MSILEELRKFGLEYCDLPTMLWNVAVGLRVLTLNIDSKYDKGIPFSYYLVTVVTAVCHFYVFLISMTWVVCFLAPQTGDMVGAMVVLSLGISTEIGTLKLFYMFIYVKKIRKIADDYLTCDSQTIPGSRFNVNLLKALRIVKKRALIYWSVIFGNGILYLLKPVVTPGRNLPENYFTIYGLEPKFETPYYEMGFFMMSAAVWFVCYVPACVTAYLIVIAGYTEAQLLALGQEMINLWPDAVKKVEAEMQITDIDEYAMSNRIEFNKCVERHLKEIIKQHAQVITLFHNVEDVFRGSIAWGFLLLVLALLTELLGKLENTYLQLPFAFMQVAMDCFTGQRVMDASVIFEQAVYDCKWENFDKNNRRYVLVMLQSAQKTMTLSAGGVAMLSFTCLMTITRGIYSAYTALRSTI